MCEWGISYICQTDWPLKYLAFECKTTSIVQGRTKSALELYAIQNGLTVAFKNADSVIANLWSPYERVIVVHKTGNSNEELQQQRCVTSQSNPVQLLPHLHTYLMLFMIIKNDDFDHYCPTNITPLNFCPTDITPLNFTWWLPDRFIKASQIFNFEVREHR